MDERIKAALAALEAARAAFAGAEVNGYAYLDMLSAERELARVSGAVA